MDATAKNQEDDAAMPKVATVAGAVLAEFFDTLGGLEGFTEAASKLRALVLDDGVFAEAAIRAALFGEDE